MNPPDSVELTRLLAASPLLAGLESSETELLVETAEREPYEAGETVFTQGDSGNQAYLIASGRFDALDERAGGLLRRQLEPGELFGEYSLFLDRSRSLTVRCREPGVLLVFPRERFQAFLERCPHALQQILRTTIRRLHEAEEKLRQR